MYLPMAILNANVAQKPLLERINWISILWIFIRMMVWWGINRMWSQRMNMCQSPILLLDISVLFVCESFCIWARIQIMWPMRIRCRVYNLLRLKWSRDILVAILDVESISWLKTCSGFILIGIWMAPKIRQRKISSVVNVIESFRNSNPCIST